MNLFSGKKAQSFDTVILIGIIIIFIGLGLVIPFIQRDFNSAKIDSYNTNIININNSANIDGTRTLSNSLGALGGNPVPSGSIETNAGGTSFGDLTKSVFSMFFWSFSLPLWANVIIEIFRIILYIIIIRLIRGV